MKKLILALCTLLFAAQAMATEYITNFSGATPHTGWAWDGTGWVATNVRAQGLDWTAATQGNHTYRYTFTETGWTAGSIQLIFRTPRIAVPTAPNVPTVDLNGLAPIADNFPTANGINTGGPIPATDSDPNGAMRFRCGPAALRLDDPLVFPGRPGYSHLHIFYGNTGVNAYSTYRSLRTSGGTSCGNPAAPIYRSAFWAPDMLDGKGNALLPIRDDIYYKTIPASNPICLPAGSTYDASTDTTHIGICTGNRLPNGIRWVFGYNMGTMTGGPTNGDPMFYNCNVAQGDVLKAGTPDNYPTLKAMYDAGCRSPAAIKVTIAGPNCWNGTQIDSSDHRSHVHFADAGFVNLPGGGVWAKCPTTHPYVIPVPEIHLFYRADAAWDAGLWRLSSDEQMGTAVDAGTTLHQDYWEAWSPTVKQEWVTHCIEEHRTCASGELGDGNQLNSGNGQQMRNFAFEATGEGDKVSLTRFGYSRLIQPPDSGTHTYTGEINAPNGGMISFYSPDGGSFKITALSVVDVTRNTSYAPVTSHLAVPVTPSAWSPTSASGLVAWYDPSDITTLFKDASCTTPVTADGDTVLCMKDKSSNHFDVTQPYGSTNAPIYHTGSGKPYLQATSDRWLESASHQFVSATDGTHSAGVGWVSTDNSVTSRIIIQGSSTAGVSNIAGTAEAIALSSVGGNYSDDYVTSSLTVGTSYALIKIATPTAIEMFVNNATDGSTATGALLTSAVQIGIMGQAGCCGRASGKYYGSAHYNTALSASDRASLNTYLLGKMP